jgi:alanine dehydrogenase
MPSGTTLLLTRADVVALLTMEECIAAVEQAFALAAQGKMLAPGVLGIPSTDGGFHIKAAGLELGRLYFAAKVNANFPRNMAIRGLPTIQGVIVLCDGTSGSPLAILDSIEITAVRTAAATAVAAKHLARSAADVVTVCGCGNQGRHQILALSRVLKIGRINAFDSDAERASRFADEMLSELGIAVRSTEDLRTALRESDVIVTCTPSRTPFIRRADIRAGAFIAAVGADSHDKQELDPDVFPGSKVVVDHLEQCATIGDLHHALASDMMKRTDVHAELSEVVSGARPGRIGDDEITIFDSTGTALQDVAAAAVVYEKALRTNAGLRITLA